MLGEGVTGGNIGVQFCGGFDSFFVDFGALHLGRAELGTWSQSGLISHLVQREQPLGQWWQTALHGIVDFSFRFWRRPLWHLSGQLYV